MGKNRAVVILSAALIVIGTFLIWLRLSALGAGEDPFFEISRFPPDLRAALLFLLMMPLGGLVISVARDLLAMRTFGYFTPVLIGVSFMHAQWAVGLTVFLLVTGLGLLGQGAAVRLGLTKRSRLTLVMLFVVIGMMGLVTLFDRMAIPVTNRCVSLPLVALTFLLGNFHRNSQKEGYRPTLIRLVNTLVVAAVCLALFRIGRIQDTMSTYPETVLFLGAVVILVGNRWQANGAVAKEDDDPED